MVTTGRCPKCQQGVLLKDVNEQGQVKCLSCGDWLPIATVLPPAKASVENSSPSEPSPAQLPGEPPVDHKGPDKSFASPTSSQSTANHDDGNLVDDEVHHEAEEFDWNTSSFDDAALDDDDGELAAMEELQAQRARAKKAKKAKPATGNGKKKSKKAPQSPNPLAQLKHPAVIGAVAVAMVLIFIGVWANLPGKKPAAQVEVAANAPGQAGEVQPADNAAVAGERKSTLLNYPNVPIVIDKPVAGVAVVAVEPPKPLFQAAPPFDEAKSLTRAAVEPEPTPSSNQNRRGRRTPTEATIEPQPKSRQDANAAAPAESPAQAVWKAEPDPRPADLRYTIAANLRFELKGPGMHQGISSGDQRDDHYPNLWLIGANSPPVLADQHGPYLIVPPVWEQCPYGRGWKLPKNKLKDPNGTFVSIEKPQKPIPVLDLRTGEPAGEYDWRVPVFRNPALSPDGRFLVGPYHNPVTAAQNEKPNEDELEQRRALYVWERDSKNPPKKLPMPGLVACMRFTAPTTIAILVEQPRRQLEIWDVVTAKPTGKIDLPLGPPTPSNNVFPYMYTDTDRSDLLVNYPRAMEMLAISPGGRYAAVTGIDGVSLVSLTDNKILGTLELKDPPLGYEDYLGMTFVPEGDELAIALRTRDGKTRFLACRLVDGVIRRQHIIGGQTRGPLWVNPDRKSFILTDFPGGTQWSQPKPPAPLLFDLDKPDAERFMYRWTTPEHMAPVVLRLPEEGPALVIQQPGYTHTADLTVPTVLAFDRETYRQDIDKKIAIDEHGLPKRPAPIVPDRSTLLVLEARPPTEWVAMPPVAPAKPIAAESIGRVAWPTAWSENGALSVMLSKQSGDGFRTVYFHEVQGRLLTFGDAVADEKKILLPWAVRPENLGWTMEGNGGLPVGLRSDSARILVNDPQYPSRVTLLERGPEAPSISFAVAEENPQPVVWTDFDRDHRVLAISGGELSCWDVKDNAIRGVFVLRGGYTTPALFSGDRSLLAVSRGGSLDLLDVATGKVLNRCGVGTGGVVIDAAFSPNGKQLAVLAAMIDGPSTARLPRGVFPKTTKGAQLALWDLSTGKAEVAVVPVSGMGLLNWITPEHIGILAHSTTIYDLKLRRACVTCNFTTSNDFPKTGFPLNVSPDGRIWLSVPESEYQADAFSHRWQVSMFSRPLSEELRPYFAADRVLFDLRNTPIQIRIDLGDKALATKHGESLAASLQKLGCQIGGGGLTFDVTAAVNGTGEYITFEKAAVEIPRVLLALRLVSPKGELVWAGGWHGTFPGEGSRYKAKKVDYETRVRNGGSTFYDFQGRDPTKAMVEEILQTMRPVAVDSTFPALRFFGDGRFVEVEKAVSWELAPNKQ